MKKTNAKIFCIVILFSLMALQCVLPANAEVDRYDVSINPDLVGLWTAIEMTEDGETIKPEWVGMTATVDLRTDGTCTVNIGLLGMKELREGVWVYKDETGVVITDSSSMPFTVDKDMLVIDYGNEGLLMTRADLTDRPAQGNLVSPENAFGIGPSPDERFEDGGHTTPEEAVLAYLEAFGKGDIQGMLSTFAIESWVDHKDSIIYQERKYGSTYQGFNEGEIANNVSAVPVTGEFSRNIQIAMRYRELAKMLYVDYCAAVLPEDFDIPFTAVTIQEQNDVLEKMLDAQTIPWAQDVEFVEWVDLEEYENYPGLISRICRDNLVAGGDDYSILVPHLRIAGQDYVLYMTCALYGGRWFNLAFGNDVLGFMPEGPTSAAITYRMTRSIEETLNGLGAPVESQIQMIRERTDSSLCGTHWSLISEDTGFDAVIVDNFDQLTDEGYAVWGELRFTRGTAILRLIQTPDFQRDRPLIGNGNPAKMSSNLLFDWQYQNSSAVLNSNEKEIPLLLTGDTITLQDPETEVTYTFALCEETMRGSSVNTVRHDRFEGEGYDSPRDALKAYIEAMNQGNAEAMTNTFAIESWVARKNIVEYLRFGCRSAVIEGGYLMPVDCEYSRVLATACRYGQIAEYIHGQYMQFTLKAGGASVKNSGGGSKKLYDFMRLEPSQYWQGRVELVEWIDPAQLVSYQGTSSEVEAQEVFERLSSSNAVKTAEIDGCDDWDEVLARVRLNGQEAILCMRCGKYGSRWYNLDMEGYYSAAMNINLYERGLYMHFPEFLTSSRRRNEVDIIALCTTAPDADYQRLCSENAESPLQGTYWRMTDIEMPGVRVAKDRDELCRTDEDMAVYGLIRFFRYGLILWLEPSAAVPKDAALLGDMKKTSIVIPWIANGTGFVCDSYDDIEQMIDIDEDTFSFTYSYTGLTCTFEKEDRADE